MRPLLPCSREQLPATACPGQLLPATAACAAHMLCVGLDMIAVHEHESNDLQVPASVNRDLRHSDVLLHHHMSCLETPGLALDSASDAIAVACRWTMHCLAQNPQFVTRLQAEVRFGSLLQPTEKRGLWSMPGTVMHAPQAHLGSHPDLSAVDLWLCQQAA